MLKYDYIASSIRVNVIQYKQSQIENNTVFFVIEVANKENKWVIEKRFSEFDNLSKALTINFHNIPKLPSKSYLFKMTQKDLESRRKGLEEFLQSLVCRNDLVNSEAVKQFLQLDKNASSSIVNPPKLLQQFQIDGLSKGVNDFTFIKQDEIFYMATGDMNPISRLGAYMKNSKMPWEKEQSKDKILLEVGSVQGWSRNGETFIMRWKKSYPDQAVRIQYNAASELALIGLDDGILDILKVTALGYEDVAISKIHQSTITGIYYDSLNSIVYTISEDKFLRISEGTTLMLIVAIPHKDPLFSLVADKINKRLFIGSKGGEIFIYDISAKHSAKQIISLHTNKKSAIRTMELDLNRNYLFTGGEDGEIGVFDLDKPGREKYTKQVAALQGKEGVRSIVWLASKSELIVGTVDGSVTFWNAVKGKSLYVLQSNQGDITKLHIIPDTLNLITGTKGKSVKFWNIPKEWRDALLEAQQEKEAEQRRKQRNINYVKDAVTKAQQDSDDDDLAGWHLD